MKQRVIIAVLGAVAVGAAGIAVAGRSAEPSPGVSLKPSSAAKPPGAQARPRSGAGPKYGYVEGSLAYPGESIPGDIRICAVNLATSSETCTRDVIRHGRFKGGRGYRLGVPPGEYRVYAVVPSFDPGYQAFYSAFVVCGYHAGCGDHSPITIRVTAGKTVADIEPGDFYE